MKRTGNVSDVFSVYTFARIIVSKDETRTYYLAFKRLFECVSNLLQKPVQWHHLHNAGFRAIIVDMSLKQAAGTYVERIAIVSNMFRHWKVPSRARYAISSLAMAGAKHNRILYDSFRTKYFTCSWHCSFAWKRSF